MATGRVGEGQGLRRTSQASRQMVQSLLGNSWANLVGLVLDPRMTVPRCDSRGLRTQAQPRQDWGAFNPTWTGLPGKVSGLQIRSKGQGPTPTIQGEVLTLAPGRKKGSWPCSTQRLFPPHPYASQMLFQTFGKMWGSPRGFVWAWL